MKTADAIRKAVLSTVDPVVLAAVAEGCFGHNKAIHAILIAEGLATPAEGRSWLTWTQEGRLLHDMLEAEFTARAEAIEAAEPDVDESADAPSVASAIAHIRAEAQARGGAK